MYDTRSKTQHNDSATQADEVDLTAHRAAACLCSALYHDPALWPEVRLTPEQMPSSYARIVFRALVKLREKGLSPDRPALAAAIREVEGPRGLEDSLVSWALAESPNPANVGLYQEIIEQDAEFRHVRQAVTLASQHLEEGDAKAAMAVLVDAARTPAGIVTRAATATDVLLDVFAEIEKPEPAISVGLDPLDDMLDGGIRDGELMVIAARPGMGKSALALQMILHAARARVPVTVWSLEMSKEQWIRRALVTLSRVPLKKLRGGKALSPEDYTALAWAAGELHKMPIRIADTTDTTPEGWRLEATREVREHGARLLVIDYIQLMQPDRKAHSREQEVARLSRAVKVASIELDVPIIALAQLNRDAENRVPTMANLRESGAIEADANQIFLLHREIDEATRKPKAEGLGIVAKNRDGDTGAFPLRYEREFYRFVPVSNKPEPPEVANRHKSGRRWPYDD